MNKVKLFLAALIVATGANSYGQMPEHIANPKLIAVVNSATWCGVCKANSARFGAVLMPYSKKGVNIYMNDLSDEKTKAVSKQELVEADIYNAVVSVPRKGMGKALKACRIVKDKKQSTEVSGIVTFIDPKTHKQLQQMSIAVPDAEMNSSINNLLN